VAGGEQDTTRGLSESDDMAGCGSRQNAILSDQELLDAIGSADFGNQLDNFWIPKSSITTDDKERVWLECIVSYCGACEGYTPIELRGNKPWTPSGIDKRILATKASL
jgi:hypothetical protein